MGLSTRFFFVSDKGDLIKVPTAKFCRFYDGDPDTRFPEYKNQRIRLVDITVELEKRKPVGILWECYGYIVFDKEGRFVRKNADEHFQVAMTGLCDDLGLSFRKPPKTIINRKAEFAERILKNRFRWTPSPSLQEAIYREVLG
jgi:hypothetical protein